MSHLDDSLLLFLVTGVKRKRCGTCDGCNRSDCGICKLCNNKPKFVGMGIKKAILRAKKV